MQLHVAFDDELLLKYHQRNSPLFFEIYFENEGKFYPEERHMDFGEVILGWWTYDILQYFENAEIPEFTFMEGDLDLKFDEEFNCVLGKTSVEELSLIVKLAIEKVIAKKKELQLSTKRLEVHLKRLNQLMTDSTF